MFAAGISMSPSCAGYFRPFWPGMFKTPFTGYTASVKASSFRGRGGDGVKTYGKGSYQKNGKTQKRKLPRRTRASYPPRTHRCGKTCSLSEPPPRNGRRRQRGESRERSSPRHHEHSGDPIPWIAARCRRSGVSGGWFLLP